MQNSIHAVPPEVSPDSPQYLFLSSPLFVRFPDGTIKETTIVNIVNEFDWSDDVLRAMKEWIVSGKAIADIDNILSINPDNVAGVSWHGTLEAAKEMPLELAEEVDY